MGSDSTKVHETFAVAPADADEPEIAGGPGDDELDDAAPDTSTPAGKLGHTLGLVEGLGEYTDADHLHADLVWLVESAHAELDAAGFDDEDRELARKQLAAAAADALATLPDDKVHELAANQGFAHPTLVSTGALAHWLNPAYPADAASKVKIAAKADERYHQLAAGEADEIHGQTLADVQAADAQLTPPQEATESWQASPGEVAMASPTSTSASPTSSPPATATTAASLPSLRRNGGCTPPRATRWPPPTWRPPRQPPAA